MIATAINIDYFKGFIGQTRAIYLLIYIAGLIICQKNVAMTRIEQFIRLGKHDSFYKMLNGISLTSIMLTKFFVGWIEKHRKCAGWLCLDDTVIEVELPGYGSVLVYRDGSHKVPRWLINSDAMCSAREVKKRYDNRWEIEEVFRFMKQNLGLEGCQCRRKTAVRNHISLVFLAHFVMEIFSARQSLNPYGCSMIIFMDYFGLNKKLPELHQRKVFMKSIA